LGFKNVLNKQQAEAVVYNLFDSCLAELERKNGKNQLTELARIKRGERGMGEGKR